MGNASKIYQYVKPYKKLAIFSLVMLVAMVGFDLAIPRLVQHVIDAGIREKNMQVVINTSIIMLIISLLDALVAVLNNLASVKVGESVARDLRVSVFSRVQTLSHNDLDRFPTGILMVRLTSDTSAVQRFVQVTLRIGTRAPLSMIGSIIFMFLTSPSLALTMIPVLLIAALAVILFSAKMEPIFRSVQQKLDRLNTVLQENIAGVRLVKSFVRAGMESSRFGKANEELTGRTVLVMRLMSSLGPALTLLINMGMVLVIWMGGDQAIKGTLTPGQLVAFTNYLLAIMGPLVMMTQLSNTWANGFASMHRISEVLEAEHDMVRVADEKPLPPSGPWPLEFRNVSFRYEGNDGVPVLENISFTAERGQTIAILGATGSGKSTLVNLIPRFYDPTSGGIYIAGQNIRTVTADSLLGHIGIVPQETILFSGSVRDNIRYGRINASEDDVLAAAKDAEAHDFICALPKGYDTHIAERGVNLSGGQKQRLAIARAILANPDILILDDSTSSVDADTETRIQTALSRVMRGKICIVVAQRISTVLNADKIIVLDEGRIVSEGSHSELLGTSPIYREIFESQLGVLPEGYIHNGK